MKLKTLALIAASAAITLPAFAADPAWMITENDTSFGENISNEATLTYNVGSTPIVRSDTIDFKVDRKVIFNLSSSATGNVSLDAGSSADFTYTLTNDSNAPISFKLPVPPANTTYTIRNIGENTGGTVINSGTSTTSTDLIIDLTIGDIDTTNTDQKLIIVTYTAPTTASEGDEFDPTLSITAIEPATNGNIGLSEDDKGVTKGDLIEAIDNTKDWVSTVIQTVADPDAIVGSEVKISGPQLFEINSAVISLSKTVTILSDPINLAVKPKAIPGAIVEYTLTIKNTGSLSASGITLSDLVPSPFIIDDADYTETYFVNSDVVTPNLTTGLGVVELTQVGNALTFSKLSVVADPNLSDDDDNGVTTITFTVQLP